MEHNSRFSSSHIKKNNETTEVNFNDVFNLTKIFQI